MKKLLQRSIAIYVSANFILAPLYAAQVKVKIPNLQKVRSYPLKIDKPNNRVNTNIKTSTNGVPIVNIGRLNSAGISHNRFTDYNVNQKGLILNNSGKTVDTKLAGEIKGNSNLSKNEAAILIINEVTSNSETHLNGYTEVAGKSSDVIVANPNGITVNGGGFINTSRALLTTGKVQKNANGIFTGVKQHKGSIKIEGKGLSSSNRVSLYSPKLDIDGNIVAGEIDLRAGEADVDYKSGKISNAKSTNSYVIDSTALGGMYADKISIEVGSQGAGINLGGDVLAGTVGFKVDSSGKLIITNASSTGDIALKSHNIDVTKVLSADKEIRVQAKKINIQTAVAKGHIKLESAEGSIEVAQLYGDKNIDINAKNSIKNTDVIFAKGEISTHSNSLNNQGAIVAQKKVSLYHTTINNAGKIESKQKEVEIESQTLRNTGAILAGDRLTIDTPLLTNEGGVLSAKNRTLLNVTTLNGSNGKVHGGGVTINAKNIDSTGARITSSDDILLNVDDQIRIEDGEIISVNDNIIKSKALQLSRSTIASTQENVTFDAETLHAISSTIKANKTLHFNVTGEQVLDESTLLADTLRLHSDNDVSLKKVVIATDTLLDVEAKNIRTPQSRIHSGDILHLKANETLDITKASLSSNNSLDLTASNIDANGSEIVAKGEMLIKATQNFNQSQQAKIAGEGKIDIEADVFVHENDSTLQGDADVLIKTRLLKNNEGSYLGAKDLEIQSTSVENQDANLSAFNSLHIVASNVDNNRGNIRSDGTIAIEASSKIDNTQGDIHSNAGTHIQTPLLNNEEGLLSSIKRVWLELFSLEGDDSSIQADGVTIQTTTMAGKRTNIASSDDIVIEAVSNIDLEDSDIVAVNNVDITTKSATLKTSEIVSGEKDVILNAENLVAEQTRFQAAQKSKLTTSQSQSHLKSEVVAKNVTLQSTGTKLTLEDSKLNAKEHLAVYAVDAETINTTLESNNTMGLTVSNTLRARTNSKLIAQGDIEIDAQTFIQENNTSTRSKSKVWIKADRMENIQSNVQANDIQADVGVLRNKEGVFSSLKSMLLNLDDLRGNKGTLQAETITINTIDSHSTEATIEASDTLNIHTTGDLSFTDSKLLAENDLLIDGTEAHFTRSSIASSNKDVKVDIDTLTATDTHFQAKETLDIEGKLEQNINNSTLYAKQIIVGSREGSLNVNDTKANAEQTLLVKTFNMNNNRNELFANDLLKFDISGVANSAYGTFLSQNLITFAGTSFNDSYGKWVSGKEITTPITHLSFSNSDVFANDILLNAQNYEAHGATVRAEEKLEIDVSTGLSDNTVHESNNTLTLKASQSFTQSNGAKLYNRNDITIDANDFVQASNAEVKTNADIYIKGNLHNRDGGRIIATKVNIDTTELENKDASILSVNDLTIKTTNLDNNHGEIRSNTVLDIEASNLASTNNGGRLHGDDETHIKAQTLESSGIITSVKKVFLELFNLTGEAGIITAPSVVIDTTNIDTTGVDIESTDALSIDVVGDANLKNGSLISNKKVTLKANNIDISGTTVYSKNEEITIDTDRLDAVDSRLETKTFIDVKSTDADFSKAVVKSDLLTFNTNSLTTGSLDARRININSNELLQKDGQIVATEQANINVNDTLSSDGGIITSTKLYVNTKNLTQANAATIYGDTVLDLKVANKVKQTNKSRIISKTDLTLKSKSHEISDSLVYANNGAIVNSDALTSYKGRINSGSTMRINVANFNNNGGSFTSTSDNIYMNIGNSLSNRHGEIYINGDLTLRVGGTLDNTYGTLTSGATLDVLAGNYIFNHTNMLAVRDLRLEGTIQNIDRNTQILSLGSLTLNSNTTLNNSGLILAKGRTIVRANGNLNNRGTIVAKGSLGVSAGTIKNYIGASLEGGSYSRIDANGNILNYGKLSSTSKLQVTASSIDNEGWIGAQQELNIQTGNLVNFRTIFSNNRMNLHVSNKLHNISNGNSRGHIESRGDMYIAANYLENKGNPTPSAGVTYVNQGTGVSYATEAEAKNSFSLEHETSYHSSTSGSADAWVRNITEQLRTETPLLYTQANINQIANLAFILPALKISATNTSTSDSAFISSGGSITFNTNSLRNQDARISAAGNIALRGNVENVGTTKEVTTGDVYYHSYAKKKSTLGFKYHVSRSRFEQPNATTTIVGPSLIVAGGTISGKIGGIENGFVDHSSDVASVSSTGISTGDTSKRHSTVGEDNTQQFYDIIGEENLDVSVAGGANVSNGATSFNAGGSVNGGFGSSTQNFGSSLAGDQLGHTPFEPNLQNLSPLALSIIKRAKDANPEAFAAHENIGKDLSPDQYNLFIANPDENGPSIILNKFAGIADGYPTSDVLLNAIGYDRTAGLRRFGDGAYETRLVREEIMTLTGRRFITNAKSDTQQYQNLLRGGAAFAKNVGLEVGVAPTKAQLAYLKEDIVWIVTKNINGQNFLVPKVYLANKYIRPNGAYIGANNINLEVSGAVKNAGIIKAQELLRIKANSLENVHGSLLAENGLVRVATIGDITNLSGIIKGNAVSLSSEEGSIISKTLSTQSGGSDFNSTYLHTQAQITSTEGAVTLQAREDINSTGAVLTSSGGNLNLIAKNINVNTVEDTLAYDFTFDDGNMTGSNVRHLTSTLNAEGGTLNIQASNNVLLEAVEVDASNTNIFAGNRVDVTAVIDSSYVKSHFESDGWFSNEKSDFEGLQESVLGTSITTDNLQLSGTNGVLIESGDIQVVNNASITSTNGDVTLIAKAYTNASNHEYSGESFFNLLGEEGLDQYSSTKWAGTSVTAGNALTVNGQVITLAGSSLKGKNTRITGQMLNLIDLKETETSSRHSDDSGILIRTISDKGYVKQSAVGALIEGSAQLIVNNKDLSGKLSSANIINSSTQLAQLTPIQVRQVQTTLEQKEWDETQVMLSKMGSLIVQAVATYLTAGVGTALTAGMTEGAIQVATKAAINSIARQVTSSVLESAITGNKLELDLGDIARNALKSGVSAGLNANISTALNDAGMEGTFESDIIQTTTQSATQSALYGTDFKDTLISNATGKVTDRAFEAVGDTAFQEQFGSNGETFEDGGLGKTILHATAGGTASLLMGGDFTSGALVAGSREALSPLTEDFSEKGQRLVSSLTGIIVGKASGGDEGADRGYTIALSAEVNNRQLHQKEIDFLKDEKNIEAFAKELYGDNPTQEQLDDAEIYLAKGGISLVDSSYSKVVGGQDADSKTFNENVTKAEYFIEENFGDSITFNYKDGNGNMVITHGFQATKEERDDRYGNLEGFNDNRDFYEQNLNFNTGKVGSASDYAKGGLDAVGNVIDAIKSDPVGVAKSALEGWLDPIDSGYETGQALGEENTKIDLDEMMGDDASANEHRGARDLAIATAVLPATGKIFKIGGKYYSKLKNGKTIEVSIDGKPKIEKDSKGNTIVREPKTLQDKMAMDAAKNGEGTKLDIDVKDPNYPNHDKMEVKVTSKDGKTTVVHYMKDKTTGEVSDVKIKKHSDGTVNEDDGYRQLTENEKSVETRKSNDELHKVENNDIKSTNKNQTEEDFNTGNYEKPSKESVQTQKDSDTKGPYSSNKQKENLEATYGAENVSSSTLPDKPKQASPAREDVIIGDDGSRAVKVTTESGETKWIPYDERGLPVFDDVSKYTTSIKKPTNYENMSDKARRSAEMRAATRQLRDDIDSGKVDGSQFTEKQLIEIRKGKDRIPGYTWHHNAQSSPNNMQLVPSKIHNVKEGGIPHSGEGSMSNGK